MLASLTLDVITTFVCNTGKTNHQMNKFITLYERILRPEMMNFPTWGGPELLTPPYYPWLA